MNQLDEVHSRFVELYADGIDEGEALLRAFADIGVPLGPVAALTREEQQRPVRRRGILGRLWRALWSGWVVFT